MNNQQTENYYAEELPNVWEFIQRKIKNLLKWDTLTKRLPIFKWLPSYKLRYLLADFIAGVTVGLTAIPQGIAYAVVAGLQPQYGLYSAFMGCFVYIIFGSCKDITVGPTAIMALMVQTYTAESTDFAILICFLSGCIITLFGLLNLGFLVQFISIPVTVGFTTAAAITIASGQINALFGIPSASSEFLASWINFFSNTHKFRLNDSILGVTTFLCLIALKKLKDITGPGVCFRKYMSLSRNALLVIIGTGIAYFLTTDDWTPFKLTGEVQAGLPNFQPPPFSTTINGTHLDFPQMAIKLGTSLITIPLIAILESIAIAKAFSKGKTIDASQEMIALGLCNMLGSFVQSMPVTGSFTRTAVNNSSGVQTTLGGAFTGLLVLLALGLLAKMFYFIPKATLAAVIIAAMVFMIDYEKILFIWKSKKIDVIPFLITSVACLFIGLEYGIICGVIVNNVFILFRSARPEIEISREKVNRHEVLIVQPKQNLCFSSAEYLKQKVIKAVTLHCGSIVCVIINGQAITSLDSTVAVNLISLIEDLKLLNCDIIFLNWNKGAAGVVCRVSCKHQQLFKNDLSMEELLNQHVNGRYLSNNDMP